MNEFKVTLKNGGHLCVKSEYIDIFSIQTMLNDREVFIKIGNTVLAKDSIVVIEKFEKTKKEN